MFSFFNRVFNQTQNWFSKTAFTFGLIPSLFSPKSKVEIAKNSNHLSIKIFSSQKTRNKIHRTLNLDQALTVIKHHQDNNKNSAFLTQLKTQSFYKKISDACDSLVAMGLFRPRPAMDVKQ